jgi:putative hemolysin
MSAMQTSPAIVVALASSAALCLPAAHAQTSVTRANPASTHCVDQGGSLAFEKDGSGGQFGLWRFDDNRQCEEWALLRGQCPAGGIRVTGYVTPAARYCALRGGHYQVLSGSNTAIELGSCGFANGKSCAAGAFFDGLCAPATAGGTVHALFRCDAGRTLDAVFSNGAQNSVSLVLSDGRALTLPQAMSASGARYANARESLVFWNKGNAAFIDENGKPTYRGCVTQR